MTPDFSKYDDYVDMPENEFDEIGEYIPEEVFHYTKMSTALTKILPNKEILLGNLHQTNDPLETQNRFREWINESSNPYEPQGLIRDFVEPIGIKDINIKVLSTCCHNNPSWKSTYPQSEIYKYGNSRFSMWAHYSERHTGVCILFDGKALDNNIRKRVEENGSVQNGFVKYNYEKSIQRFQGNNHEEIWNNYRQNFLCKSPDWKPEHEFRWLVRLENDSKLLVPIENAIKAVIVGKDFDKECLPLLQKLCQELSISPWQIKWEYNLLFIDNPQT
jgi:hypothetical protein